MDEQIRLILALSGATNEQRLELIGVAMTGTKIPRDLECTKNGYYYEMQHVVFEDNVMRRADDTTYMCNDISSITNGRAQKLHDVLSQLDIKTLPLRYSYTIAPKYFKSYVENMLAIRHNNYHIYYTAVPMKTAIPTEKTNSLVKHGMYLDRYAFIIYEYGKIVSHRVLDEATFDQIMTLWRITSGNDLITMHIAYAMLQCEGFATELDVNQIHRITVYYDGHYLAKYRNNTKKTIYVNHLTPDITCCRSKTLSQINLYDKLDMLVHNNELSGRFTIPIKYHIYSSIIEKYCIDRKYKYIQTVAQDHIIEFW